MSLTEPVFPRRNLKSALRSAIYDHTFARLTTRWYRAVFEHLPSGAYVLDVGIGTGSAIAANAELVKKKGIRILGVDIDPDYIARCRKNLQRAGLEKQVVARLESVYDHRGGPYDAVYFSSSFMLLPDPVRALRHVLPQLKPGGKIYFTQTFQEKRSPLVEKIKPMLHKVTTIHFGRVTYWNDFIETLERGGAEVEAYHVLKDLKNATFRLVIAKPKG